MKKPLQNRKKGFTLLEVLITVVVIAGLAALVVPRVLDQVGKSKKAEAITNLGAIRSAEILTHNLTGKFVAAEDEAGIESALGISVKGLFYSYKIIEVNDENFLAIATPLGVLENWLEELEIDKDGFVGSSWGTGSGSSSSSGAGGGDGGGSGGSGGGSSGGGGGGGGGGGARDAIFSDDNSTKTPFTGYAKDEQEVIDTLLLSDATLTSHGATTGKALSEFVTNNKIPVKFIDVANMPCGKEALGCCQSWSDGTSEIYILDTYKGNKYAAAAILGHEALHATWRKDYADYDYWHTKSEPAIGMPIPDGTIRHGYSEDQEYNTKKSGGEIWADFSNKYPTLVKDDNELWYQLEADKRSFVGVPEDEAKGYLTSLYKYTFDYKY